MQPPTLSGVLVVDKPVGWTSAEVVRRVKRCAGGAKVGHAGTLDPLASGVVICCLGRQATRAVPVLMALPKVYEAAVDLSAFTATDDREGNLEPVAVAQPPDEAAVRAALTRFVGRIEQTPPAYSAVHVGGQRAYRLARQGRPVELAPRQVEVHAIELLSYGWPTAVLRVDCGKGVYIRSLARDLGRALGTGGHLASLRRIRVGAYEASQGVPGDALDAEVVRARLLPVPSPLGAVPR